MANCKAIIMAGGSGERFWPLSRRAHPKQLLRITDPDRSLLESCVDRIAPLVPHEDIFVVTGRHLQDAIRASDSGVPAANVIAEPCKRNTAGCLVYAAAQLLAIEGDGADDCVMAVLTADYTTNDDEAFRQALASAVAAASRHDALVTLGVQPSRPETGYGYIEVADGAEDVPGLAAPCPVFPVKQFHEKPDRKTAEDYLDSGRFYWNSGMFVWRVGTFLDELAQAAPDMHRALRDITEALRNGDQERADQRFAELNDVSIDYALLEKARSIYVVPAAFHWDDVGSWDALERALPTDAEKNVTVGEPVLVDSHDCIVYNAPGKGENAVAVVGASNLVVVVTDDATLVVSKDRVQDIKGVIARLKERGSPQV